MARTRFTGPIRSSQGFEVGTGSTNTTVITSTGGVTADVTGNVTGELSITNSTQDLTTMGTTAGPRASAGYCKIYISSSGASVLVTSTGVIAI